MLNIPLNAEVECTDGSCGQSTCLIVNPLSETVTHVVVREKWMPHTEFMVPLDRVVDTSSEAIKLACTIAEFRQMESFVGTHYVESSHYQPYYGWDTMMAYPYAVPPEGVDLPAEYERVPPGQLAVHRGTYVQATDGLVGQVDELLIDPESGHITHLVLRKGHLWGKKVLTLPVSEIDHTDDENVYLKLDKQTVSSLPAIPLKLRPDSPEVDLLIKTFPETGTADTALKSLKQLTKDKAIAVINAAVIAKDADSKTSLKETTDVGPGQGAIFGAITGGLVGLLGGPVGAVVGAAAGAVTGRAAAKHIDMGLPDDYLRNLQAELEPGSSALIILVDQKWTDQISEALSGYEGQLGRHTLSEETMAQLRSDTQADEAQQ
jgi:uncharacterized membrane protein